MAFRSGCEAAVRCSCRCLSSHSSPVQLRLETLSGSQANGDGATGGVDQQCCAAVFLKGPRVCVCVSGIRLRLAQARPTTAEARHADHSWQRRRWDAELLHDLCSSPAPNAPITYPKSPVIVLSFKSDAKTLGKGIFQLNMSDGFDKIVTAVSHSLSHSLDFILKIHSNHHLIYSQSSPRDLLIMNMQFFAQIE